MSDVKAVIWALAFVLYPLSVFAFGFALGAEVDKGWPPIAKFIAYCGTAITLTVLGYISLAGLIDSGQE